MIWRGSINKSVPALTAVSASRVRAQEIRIVVGRGLGDIWLGNEFNAANGVWPVGKADPS